MPDRYEIMLATQIFGKEWSVGAAQQFQFLPYNPDRVALAFLVSAGDSVALVMDGLVSDGPRVRLNDTQGNWFRANLWDDGALVQRGWTNIVQANSFVLSVFETVRVK